MFFRTGAVCQQDVPNSNPKGRIYFTGDYYGVKFFFKFLKTLSDKDLDYLMFGLLDAAPLVSSIDSDENTMTVNEFFKFIGAYDSD